ncbi:BNR repeat-containing family member [Spirosomataceae bacterium TFI 002]|nr:BNR repeat-containing family member [Spirosomataceae bacterium TFI 002]
MRFFAAILLLAAFSSYAQNRIEIDKVWSGHQVGFSLLSDGDYQYVAYYNSERRMTVGQRKLNENKFNITILPKSPETILGWDSHNYVTIGIDSDGYIHLSGNMHAVPLIYFKGDKPRDISSLKRVSTMTGKEELRCTYPQFMTTKDGNLLFTYRDGGSGNGNQIYNLYNSKSKKWTRLLDTPLTDGQGQMNAYISLPKLGSDGYYHTSWVWRDTPDCSTNHDLSYMKSPDLINWYTAKNEALTLPITANEKRVIADPTQPKGGLINGGFRFCLDKDKKPTFVFHKYDSSGNIQLYCSRFENNTWNTKQLTNWDYRWEFSGNGSINSELKIKKLELINQKNFEVSFWHIKYGNGKIVVDNSLTVTDEIYSETKPESGVFNKLISQKANDMGHSTDGHSYELQWESLGKNRDKESALPTPPPSTLFLIKH